jgi:putative aldouronate transport system permease protein
LFCIPGLVLIFIFNYLPMFDGIMLAFKRYMPKLGINGSPWIGFTNFEKFFSSYNFTKYLINTLRLSIYSLVVGFPAPIIFAIMVNEVINRKFKKVVQTISYAPNFISVVVIVGMINLFFDDQGLVNHIITFLGGNVVDFKMHTYLFPHFYVWSGIWQGLGYSAIIYIATLSNVDPELVDAAKIDGASKVQRIWHIEIPVLVPTITIMLIFSLGGLMGVAFEKVLLMQLPLNLDYSEVLATYVYKVGILNSQYSFSAAVGLFYSVVSLILLTVFNYIAKYVSRTSLW